jgi:hypothetical protein
VIVFHLAHRLSVAAGSRLSTAMPRILVLVLLLVSSYHFLLSLANSLLG